MAATTGPADAPLPGARTALILLLAINLFNYLDRYVLAAVVPRVREEFFGENATPSPAAEQFLAWFEGVFGFRGENALIGALAMAFMVAYMVTAPIFGWLGDRMSRWWLAGVGVILWSFASGMSGLAETFIILLITRCFVGLGEAAYGPVAPTVISDLYPVKRRGAVLAWFYMAIPVGSALGFALGGLVADSSLGWRWAFYLVVPPGIALGLVCFLMRDPPRGQADAAGHSLAPLPQAAPTPKPGWKGYWILLKTPSYLICTVGMTAMTFAIGGIAFWMPDYVHVHRGVANLGQVSLIFGAITVVAGLAATLLGGMAGDYLRTKYPGSYFFVSGVGMLVGFPLFLLVLVTPFPWAWILVFLSIFCLFFNTGPTNTILANVVHPSIRSTGFALNILIIHLFGDAISPTIIGAIADAHDMNVSFFVVSLMMLVSGVLWLWGARYLKRDTELAPIRVATWPLAASQSRARPE